MPKDDHDYNSDSLKIVYVKTPTHLNIVPFCPQKIILCWTISSKIVTAICYHVVIVRNISVGFTMLHATQDLSQNHWQEQYNIRIGPFLKLSTTQFLKNNGVVFCYPLLTSFLYYLRLWVKICDMIKGNESDVTDIAFEILAKKESELFYFILFWEFIHFLQLCNQIFHSNVVCIKM